LSRYVLLGLGKLGGKEMSYHSDLDLILIYEGDGRTLPPPGSTRFDRFELTDNFHFFTELAQHIIKMASYLGPMGRLYQVDMRLRPTGKSGSLVIPLEEFVRYYEDNGAQLWERQALTRARVVQGDEEFGKEVMEAVRRAAYQIPWKPEICAEIRHMRERVQANSSGRDLKRGFGGIADIDFILQMFRIKYGQVHPAVREPNTWKALDALLGCQLISAQEHATLRSCYDFLRLVESRLRIFHNRSLDEMPEQPVEIEKLARRIGSGTAPGQSAGQVFLRDLDRHTSQTRKLFLELFAREARSGP
jgi:glutamate-ammonia-ligase adenylyltransferase